MRSCQFWSGESGIVHRLRSDFIKRAVSSRQNGLSERKEIWYTTRRIVFVFSEIFMCSLPGCVTDVTDVLLVSRADIRGLPV